MESYMEKFKGFKVGNQIVFTIFSNTSYFYSLLCSMWQNTEIKFKHRFTRVSRTLISQNLWYSLDGFNPYKNKRLINSKECKKHAKKIFNGNWNLISQIFRSKIFCGNFLIQIYRHTNLVIHWLVINVGSSTWFLPRCFWSYTVYWGCLILVNW